MAFLTAFILIMFSSTESATVISTLGSNATVSIVTPKYNDLTVRFFEGALLFSVKVGPPPTEDISDKEYHGRISNIIQKENRITFTLHNVTKEDAGCYECMNDSLVIPSCGACLVIVKKPVTPEIQNGSIPTEGGILNLNCNSSSRSLPERHNLTMIYTWKRNDQYLPNTSSSEPDGSFISVKQLSKSDNGDDYTCQAEEIRGLKSEWSRPFTVTFEYGPADIYIDPNIDTITGDEGSSIDVRCFTDCNPVCTVVWWDRQKQKEIARGQGESILIITLASINASTQFQCSVHNNHGNKSRIIAVHVNDEQENQPPMLLIITMMSIVLVIAVILVIIIKYKKKENSHVDQDTLKKADRGMAEEAMVEAGSSDEATEVYAMVQKGGKKPEGCSKNEQAGDENPCEVSADINNDGKDCGDELALSRNCGEQNADRVIYVDLDLPQPTFQDGEAVINTREESVQYGVIDFTRTPVLDN